MPKLDKMLSNLKNLASMAAEHRPENPGDYLNLGAGLSSVLGRAHDVAKVNVGGPNAPGYSQRFYDAAKSMLRGELGITPGAAMHEMPQELMTAYETALEAKKGINPSQRLLKGLAGVTGTTPAAYEAKQKAMTEALAAERSAADARRNLLLAGVGGAGLLGAAALMGRRAEDPDTYKHSSELGWQPRGLLRQKVAATGDDAFGELSSGVNALQAAGVNRASFAGPANVPFTQQAASQALSAAGRPPVMAAPAAPMRMPRGPSAFAPELAGAPLAQQANAPVMQAATAAPAPTNRVSAATARGIFDRVAQRQAAPAQRAAPQLNLQGYSPAALQTMAQVVGLQGNFGNSRMAAGTREGTRTFTPDQARAFLQRNPNSARAFMADFKGISPGVANAALAGPGPQPQAMPQPTRTRYPQALSNVLQRRASQPGPGPLQTSSRSTGFGYGG